MTNLVNGTGRIAPLNPQSGAVPYSGSGNENFMLAGWSANLGTTNWATVYNTLNNWTTAGDPITGQAFFGLSTVGTLAPSTSSGSAPSLFGSTAGLIYNPSTAPMELYVLTTPEPGTMAIAALGSAGLFLLRRRK